jgi:hypothetical protein
MNDQILQEISEFCRQRGLAESTFGRRAVNDGKLANRLRNGGRITTDTLERIRNFMARNADAAPARRRVLFDASPPAALPVVKPAAPPVASGHAGDDPQRNFRFFDNRQKYLLFVNTCSEKWEIAHRVGMELANIHPRPPAVRVFDAGVGDGTVLARVMRNMHDRFPTMPFYIVGKEISLEDLDAPDTLELLARAPDPAAAARLTTAQISAALKRARRHHIAAKAGQIQAALRAAHLGQPAIVTAAYAASVRALIAVLATLNEQITTLQGQVEAYFGQHPDAEIIMSQPGLGPVLGARVLAESGDDPGRYASARARKNYAGTSPITRASGKKKTVAARYVRNDRLIDALMAQAFTALHASPGARACYDRQRARGASHNAALRQLANRLTGILHGCLKTRTLYDEATAWPHTTAKTEKAAA